MPFEKQRLRPSLPNILLEKQEENKLTFTNKTITDEIRVTRAVVGDLSIIKRGICMAFTRYLVSASLHSSMSEREHTYLLHISYIYNFQIFHALQTHRAIYRKNRLYSIYIYIYIYIYIDIKIYIYIDIEIYIYIYIYI